MGEYPQYKEVGWNNKLKAYIDDLIAGRRSLATKVPVADIATTTGTPSASTFLRGDGAWVTLDGSTPPGGGGGQDTTAPSTPTNLRAIEVRSTSARVAWDAATDNVGVTAYELSLNGVVQAGPITTLFSDLSGLNPSTNYSIRIRARDAAGNWSPQTTPLVITTIAAASTGYPDASNSPYLDGEGVLHYFPSYPVNTNESTQVLTPASGVIYTQADNQVIEGLYVNGGTIIVRHHGVVIRRCYLKASTSYWTVVLCQDGGTVATSTNYGATVEDCCVDGNDTPGGTGLAGIGLTIRRCNIFRCDNGGQGEDGQTWEDNFFHDFMTFYQESHTDGVQFDFGPDWPVNNWTFRHNTVLSRTVDNIGTTSCIITNQDPLSGLMSNILIEDNVFAGGAYTVYGPQRNMTDFALNNNKFWTLYYPTVGAFGPYENGIERISSTGNSVGTFAGGLVNNVITGSWVHDHFIGTPGGTSDTTPPSVPTDLASADITSDGFTVTWTASTDNVGVTAYEVFLNNVSQGTVTVTSKTFTGLTANTAYSVKVRARDAAANWSSQSSALVVNTLPDSTYVVKSVSVSSTLPSAGVQTVVTGEDIATEVGDHVIILQFSDYRLKSQTGLPTATGSVTATEIAYPGTDNGNKFRASIYEVTVAGAQTITATTTSPNDDDKRLVAIVVSGINSTTPVNVFNSVDSINSVNSGGFENYNSPAVTTDVAGAFILSVVAITGTRAFSGPEDGYTLLENEAGVGGFITYSAIYSVQSSAGDTGEISHMYTSSNSSICALTVAFKPA